MKFRLSLATATALGLLMGGALAGDNNKAFSIQDGADNTLSVTQNGGKNVAGQVGTNAHLKQTGDANSMKVTQTGNNNRVATNWPSEGNRGAHQAGNLNKLTLTQTSFGYDQHGNGHVIHTIRQTSSPTATGNTGDTNTATIIQRGAAVTGVVGQGPSAGHQITRVEQKHTGGAGNSLNITQDGAYSAHYGGGQNNQIGTVKQDGSDNTATISQNGTGPVQTTSGQQQRGPSNIIGTVQQIGDSHSASVRQNGFQNYITTVDQSVSNNSAIISLTGDGNGATRGSGHPTVGVLLGAAGIAGAAASSVVQGGGSYNQVQYTVSGGNDNQFGFRQNGDSNEAINIRITGNGNHLGVNQNGTANGLDLGRIDGDDNVIGLKQNGTENLAKVNVDGSSNVGFHDFTTGNGLGLTAGLLEQSGSFNEVSLRVSGSNNVFASLQSGLLGSGDDNKITARQLGDWNEAAVKQLGDSNAATVTQGGSFNDANVSQTGTSNVATIVQ